MHILVGLGSLRISKSWNWETNLLDSVDDMMKEKGVEKLFLHTASKIVSLVKFYYGRGFYIDSTTKIRDILEPYYVKNIVKQVNL